MIDYKALKGDPTDNIPGVPGVGEKTAAKLIRDSGRSRRSTSGIDEVKPDKLREKLIEHRDAVFMGKDLSTIVRDLPVEFDLEAARLGDYDRETVIRLFREYEFRTLIERLPAMTGETAGQRRKRFAGSRPTAPCRRHASPGGAAVRLGLGSTGPAAVRGWRAPAVARFRRRGGPAAPGWRRSGGPRPPPTATAPASRPATCRPRWPPPSPIRPGSRSTPGRPIARSNRGCRPGRGRLGLLLDDPRPRRCPACACRRGDRRPDGRGRGPGRRRRRCAGCSTGSRPRRRSRGQAVPRRRIADDPRRPTRSPSTRRSPPTCSTRPCAARPSPMSWPSSST